jgi:hypothetical protein
MPNAKNNAKLTGDTHLPDVEEGLPDELPSAADSDDAARSESGASSDAGRPGRDENAAGFVKDKDLGGKPGR